MKRKRLGICAAALFLLAVMTSGIMAGRVRAAEPSFPDGITVILTAAKDSFEKGEEVSLLLTASSPLYTAEIDYELTLPEGLPGEAGTEPAGMLIAEKGKSGSKKLILAAAEEAPSEVAPSETDTAAEESSAEESSETAEPGDENGFSFWWLCGIGIVLIIAAVLIIFLKKRKAAALLLVLLGTLGLMIGFGGVPAAAAEDGQTLETVFRYDGREFTVSASVRVRETWTRTELEDAIVETAWAFFLKEEKVQYGSQELCVLGKAWNGPWRTVNTSQVEYATSDTAIYTVCSDYPFSTFENVFGYRYLGHRLNAVTVGMHRLTRYEKTAFRREGEEKYRDAVIAQWYSPITYRMLSADRTYGVNLDPTMTEEEFRAFLADWEHNLRPGDVIVCRNQETGDGHAVFYMGCGVILDSNGKKYNMGNGRETYEPEGSVHSYHTVEGLFLDGNDPWDNNYFKIYDENTAGGCVVVRPLDWLMLDTDGDTVSSDGDSFNLDYVQPVNPYARVSRDLQTSGFRLTDASKTRLEYPGMEIDRTSDISPFGTVAEGGGITYCIRIANKSNDPDYCRFQSLKRGGTYSGEDYRDLPVTETVPAGTVLTAASEGAVIKDGILTWHVDIRAGETAELWFTVKAEAGRGSEIVCGSGFVGKIPSNTLTNLVGGAKLTAELQQRLQEAYISDLSAAVGENAADTDFAEEFYRKVLGLRLDLPASGELIRKLFTLQRVYETERFSATSNGNKNAGNYKYLYLLKEAPDAEEKQYMDMLVKNYYGGMYTFYDKEISEGRINEFSERFLEPGDITLLLKLSDYHDDTEPRSVTESTVLIYLGNGKFVMKTNDGKIAKLNSMDKMWTAFTYDIFFTLRPSQAAADISNDSSGRRVELQPASIDGEGSLTAEQRKALAALTAEDAAADNPGTQYNFLNQMFSRIGLNTTPLLNNTMIGWLNYKVIGTSRGNSAGNPVPYGYSFFTEEEAKTKSSNLKQYAMFVPESAGGNNLLSGISQILPLEQFLPGDVLQIGSAGESFSGKGLEKSLYIIMIYQGNGRFIGSLSREIPDFGAHVVQTPGGQLYFTLDASVNRSLYEDLYKMTFTSTDGSTVGHQVWFVLRPVDAM